MKKGEKAVIGILSIGAVALALWYAIRSAGNGNGGDPNYVQVWDMGTYLKIDWTSQTSGQMVSGGWYPENFIQELNYYLSIGEMNIIQYDSAIEQFNALGY